MTNILVTGGAGRLGREVVKQLLDAGYTVRIMSRHSQPVPLAPDIEWVQADLKTGQGLADAVSGIDVIVHAATDVVRSRRVDVNGTQLLLSQARQSSVGHIVYASIVGVDRIPFFYYRNKLATEEIVRNSGLPWSLLRATQFHYLLDLYFQAVTKPPLLAVLPSDLRFQTVDAAEVAARLCAAVAAGPSERLPDMGGPEVLTTGEMLRTWLSQRAMPRRVVHVPLPGNVACGFRLGYNTCPAESLHGQITWTQWLQRTYQTS